MELVLATTLLFLLSIGPVNPFLQRVPNRRLQAAPKVASGLHRHGWLHITIDHTALTTRQPSLLLDHRLGFLTLVDLRQPPFNRKLLHPQMIARQNQFVLGRNHHGTAPRPAKGSVDLVAPSFPQVQKGLVQVNPRLGRPLAQPLQIGGRKGLAHIVVGKNGIEDDQKPFFLGILPVQIRQLTEVFRGDGKQDIRSLSPFLRQFDAALEVTKAVDLPGGIVLGFVDGIEGKMEHVHQATQPFAILWIEEGIRGDGGDEPVLLGQQQKVSQFPVE